jgi:phage terminase small subunit
MPRKSRAAQEIAPYMRPTEVLPLPPPTTLSEPARTVWIHLVSAHEPEHFQEGDATLLQQYCEASALAAKAAAALQAGDDTRLKIWERATAIMASLALRLRLGPQSRREKARATTC